MRGMTRGVLVWACWIVAAGLLLFEGFVWIRFGKWPGYSVMDAIAYLGTPGMLRWARAPLAWPWLHKALVAIPLPVVFVVLAVCLTPRRSQQ
jgi:hypothetical protein